MKVTLLPSSLDQTGPEPAQFLTSYLFNENFAIDAGCLGFSLALEEQARIDHVFLSHAHLDHVASLPIFLENVFEMRASPVVVHGTAPVLEDVRRHFFNGRLWPDLVALSSPKGPFLQLAVLEPGRPVTIDQVRVTPVEVDHTVPTVGFIIEDGEAAVAIGSDSAPTTALWEQANQTPHLRAVFLEATFPDALAALAALSKHLTPATFAGEVRKWKGRVRIIAVHMKPRYRERIVQELDALALPELEMARFGQAYHF